MWTKLLTVLIVLITAVQLTAGDNMSHKGIIHNFFTTEDECRHTAKRQAIQLLTSYINELREDKSMFSADEAYIKHVFYKTHHTFMKNYRQCTSFASLLRAGDYDCVSASALYAILFEYLNIDYRIYEMPYHIYIEIERESQRILLETTNPESGFISEQQRIDLIKAAYFEDSKIDTSFTLVPDMSGMNKEIDIKELAGLHLYNLAIDQFNQRNFASATELINQAIALYPSHRILAIKGLLTSL
jgi:hypothetical protein